MSKINFAQDLFLETIEMKKFQEFIMNDGIQQDFINNVEKFGIVKNKSLDPTFSFFKTIKGTSANSIKIFPGVAYTSKRDRIVNDSFVELSIPMDGDDYFVKIGYLESKAEKGKVSISTTGVLSGIDTEFMSILRPQPNFPSVVQFIDSQYNLLKYEVLSVLDDYNVQLQGVFQVAESDLSYRVIGTFSPNYIPTVSDECPFRYDGSKIEIVKKPISGAFYPNIIDGEEFIIAIAKFDNGVLSISDTRLDFYLKTKDLNVLTEIPILKSSGYNIVKKNPLIAVTAVKKLSLNDKNFYKILFDWKFTITQKTIDRNNNKVIIQEGSGGKFKSILDFNLGDFNGWRLYHDHSGDYSTVIDSTLNIDNTINLFLDTIPPLVDDLLFPNDLNSMFTLLCPNSEEIAVTYEIPIAKNSTQIFKRETKIFPITNKMPEILLREDELYTITQMVVGMSYQYKSSNKQTNY